MSISIKCAAGKHIFHKLNIESNNYVPTYLGNKKMFFIFINLFTMNHLLLLLVLTDCLWEQFLYKIEGIREPGGRR